MPHYFVYIMTNNSGTLYTGMTNDLERRTAEHRSKLHSGFTKRYRITRLVYHEVASSANSGIAREKQIKSWRRSKKIELIVSVNSRWKDLALEWNEEAAPEVEG